MGAIIALARKDLRLLLRDKAGFFFTFFWPLIIAIFFGTIFGGGNNEGPTGLKIVVVDEDNSPGSKQFADTLTNASEFIVTRALAREEGEALVQHGDQVACVTITKGFGEASERVFWGEPAKLEVAVDPSRKAESGMLQGVLTKYAFMGMQKLFSDPDMGRKSARSALESLRTADTPPETRAILEPFLKSLDQFMARTPELKSEKKQGGDSKSSPMANWQPVVIESHSIASKPKQGPANYFAVSFPQGIIWGIMGACASFGISLVVERSKGTLVRLRMAPIGQSKILAGKGLACFTLTTCVAIALLVLARIAFKVVPDSVPLLALAIFSLSIAFVGIMMLLASIGRTEAAASGIGWAVMLLMAMIGGGMIPLFIMPRWLQQASIVSPVRWGIQAMEGAIWRGYTFEQMLTPCGILLGVGAVCFALGARLFSWTDR